MGVLGQGWVYGLGAGKGKVSGVCQARGKGMGQGGGEKSKWEERWRDVGRKADVGEALTWTRSEKPVWTEPCRMELRVVPTYSVSPRPSATVRTGPKSSGT